MDGHAFVDCCFRRTSLFLWTSTDTLVENPAGRDKRAKKSAVLHEEIPLGDGAAALSRIRVEVVQ